LSSIFKPSKVQKLFIRLRFNILFAGYEELDFVRNGLFSNRVLYTRFEAHRLRHCHAFVFSRRWRKKNKPPVLRVVVGSSDFF